MALAIELNQILPGYSNIFIKANNLLAYCKLLNENSLNTTKSFHTIKTFNIGLNFLIIMNESVLFIS